MASRVSPLTVPFRPWFFVGENKDRNGMAFQTMIGVTPGVTSTCQTRPMSQDVKGTRDIVNGRQGIYSTRKPLFKGV